MKKPKCPLCGGEPQIHTIACSECDTSQIACDCGLATRTTENDWKEIDECELWSEWEKLVSKFPPIMRVKQGDNLKLDFEDDILTVTGKDTDRGKLYLENCRGDVEIATPDDVEEWPWELEQKGGNEQ